MIITLQGIKQLAIVEFRELNRKYQNELKNEHHLEATLYY